ncbi:hypothetical protein [Streptococcus ferus]|uniref:hypothetical protein n=1 Tax=Streptococcus ferus TaxID=1345 RepID=UPI00359F615C
MRFERWEHVPNSYLLKNDSQAILLKGSPENIAKEELNRLFIREAKPIRKQRLKLLHNYIGHQISISPFEIKRHFLEKGDSSSSQKVRRLPSDSPQVNLQMIRKSPQIFDQSFLTGFLEIYSLKLKEAIAAYEKHLQIMTEGDLERGDSHAFIVQLKNGEVTKITPAIANAELAREELDFFNQNQN